MARKASPKALPTEPNEMAAAYRALAAPGGAPDPGGLIKEALLIALDAADHGDAELFAQAARYTQFDRGKTGARETGARVRLRGVHGLARLGHRDVIASWWKRGDLRRCATSSRAPSSDHPGRSRGPAAEDAPGRSRHGSGSLQARRTGVTKVSQEPPAHGAREE